MTAHRQNRPRRKRFWAIKIEQKTFAPRPHHSSNVAHYPCQILVDIPDIEIMVRLFHYDFFFNSYVMTLSSIMLFAALSGLLNLGNIGRDRISLGDNRWHRAVFDANGYNAYIPGSSR